MRFSDVPKNPPLASYYLAAAGATFGWNERALHAAMLLPALLAVWGVYELARRLCSRPAIAVAIAVLSPAFIVSATTLMCDVLMLCLFVWAIVAWIDGVREGSQRSFFLSAVLILAAALTKYFAACLVPLLAVYAIVEWRGARLALLWLAVPVVGLFAFQVYTHALYGTGMISGAVSYAKDQTAANLNRAGCIF